MAWLCMVLLAALGLPEIAHEKRLLAVTLEDGRELRVAGPILGDPQSVLLRLPDDSILSVATDAIRSVRALGEAQPTTAIGNAELPPPLPTQEAPIAAPRPRGWFEPGVHLDRYGNGENWWRDRQQALGDELAAAEREVQQLEAEARFLRARIGAFADRQWTIRSPIAIPWWWYLERDSDRLDLASADLGEVVEALERAIEIRDEIEFELAALPDEARRANALPGWLR